MQHLTFAAQDQDRGERLDRFLAIRLDALSRSRLSALVRQGCVTIDGVTIKTPNHRMAPGDVVALQLPELEPDVLTPEPMALVIVHEDDSVLVLDKPAGLVVHPAAGNWTGTLVQALLAHCGSSLSGIGGVRRPGIVHRLDKDTSGLMVIAKTDAAHRSLSEQFADHGRTGSLRRSYQALVWGRPDPARGSITTQIGRHPTSRLRRAVLSSGGKLAITHFHVCVSYAAAPGEREPVASLIECTLETGRTHQIRVHMAHIGHPVIGDQLYARGFQTKMSGLSETARSAMLVMNRQALHAAFLQFQHPDTGAVLSFSSALPEDMAGVMDGMTVFSA
jgi:23S rRNA pseudouridine1911/1915/1917 synthase